MSNYLWPHVLKHHRLPCASLSPGVWPYSCPLSWWCHPTISSSIAAYFSCPQSFPAAVLSSESALHIRWPKYWSFSFSISLSNEYSGLISFRISLQSRGLSSSPTPLFKSTNSSALIFLYGPTLTSIYKYWKKQ